MTYSGEEGVVVTAHFVYPDLCIVNRFLSLDV